MPSFKKIKKRIFILSISSDIGYELAIYWIAKGYKVIGTYKSFSDKCGTHVPKWIEKEFDGSDDNPEVQKMIGSSLATDLVKRLQKEGINEFHFYTLNKYELSYAVCSRLKSYKKFLQTKNEKQTGEIRI